MTSEQVPVQTLKADVKLKLGDLPVQVSIEVPTGPVRTRFLLPLVHALANKVVEAAVHKEQQEGRQISCKAGCGACCRQLVPISETEAYHIRDLVEALPEPRRSEIRARFAAARKQLEEGGLLERLLAFMKSRTEETARVGLDYFRLGVPCPFLEEESCSIHPQRPVTCREYLVTSPAEHCARPEEEQVQGVQLPVRVWRALAQMGHGSPGAGPVRWVPLVLAPEWAQAHPDEAPPRPGPELVHELFEHLTGKPIPPPPRPPAA